MNYFQDGEHRYQDYIVLGYDKILAQYDYKTVNAADIYDIVHICNYIINHIVRCIIDIIISDDTLIEEMEEIYNDEVNILEDFFENFIGKGQHIFEKKFDKVKIKDFRDLYASISY